MRTVFSVFIPGKWQLQNKGFWQRVQSISRPKWEEQQMHFFMTELGPRHFHSRRQLHVNEESFHSTTSDTARQRALPYLLFSAAAFWGVFFHSRRKNSFVEERQKHFKDGMKVQEKRSFHCGCTERRWPFLLLLRYKMQMVIKFVDSQKKDEETNDWGWSVTFIYPILNLQVVLWEWDSWKRIRELRAGELV